MTFLKTISIASMALLLAAPAFAQAPAAGTGPQKQKTEGADGPAQVGPGNLAGSQKAEGADGPAAAGPGNLSGAERQRAAYNSADRSAKTQKSDGPDGPASVGPGNRAVQR